MTWTEFYQLANLKKNHTILELGTKRSNPNNPTEHSLYFKNYKQYIKTDFEPGIDVDVVCDAHALSSKFENIDVVVSCSTFEHLIKPWVAAEEIVKILAPGGLVFVQTHQTFPLHAYPFDYFRFSKEALSSLFDLPEMKLIDCDYEYPAQIHSARVPDSYKYPAYLNVYLIAEKLI